MGDAMRTPGPWSAIVAPHGPIDIFDVNGRDIVTLYGRDLATARLIAAAPELLEALDGLLEAITAENQHHDRALTITGPTANLKWLLEACDDARAAIAKAEGRE